MVAMRHGLVAARRAVFVCGIVAAAAMLWSTTRRICAAHLDNMLVNMVAVRMMQMPIM
jgi:hypothetical protein